MGVATLTGEVSCQIFKPYAEHGVTGARQQKLNNAFPCCCYLKCSSGVPIQGR